MSRISRMGKLQMRSRVLDSDFLVPLIACTSMIPGKSMPLVYLDDVLNPREKDRAYYKWRKRGVSSMLGSGTAWHQGHADRAQPPKGNAPPHADGWTPQAPREDAEQADGASPSEGKAPPRDCKEEEEEGMRKRMRI